jgi:hypothetical protein
MTIAETKCVDSFGGVRDECGGCRRIEWDADPRPFDELGRGEVVVTG